jgi:hypothetical protein
MNKQRRERLDEAHSKLLEAYEIIEDVKNEEEEAFDNMPENLQGSERGEQMEEYIGTMEDALDSLDDVLGNLYDIIEA